METETEKAEYQELANQVAKDLEAEASFTSEDWEEEDEIPSDIEDYLDSDFPTLDEEEKRDALEVARESWRESATDNVLDIRVEASIVSGSFLVSRVILVLGTGGPHVEVSLDDDGRGEVIAFGWWKSGYAESRVEIGRHPLMSLVEYAIELGEGVGQ